MLSHVGGYNFYFKNTRKDCQHHQELHSLELADQIK